MKRIIVMFLLALFALPASWSSAAAIGPARVSYLDGDVLFRTPDGDEWLSASVNTPLDEGDAVWCPENSRTEILLPDGTIVRLDSGSQLDLLANEDSFVHLHLANGHLYLKTTQGLRENSLQIDADDTTVIPSARTRLRIDMMPNSQEDVAIIKGSAYVEGNGSRTRVHAGEQILLEEGHNEFLPLDPADGWEMWNIDQDRAQARSAMADSYLPEELRGQAAELDANGSWVTVPQYGAVWRPTVYSDNGWAPYRDGRWIWRGGEYIWISYEAWGWVPYHFGRWAVINGFGWCWVPPARGDVYWGPGYVGWYRTGSHVGWTPLAPGEKFYGRRYYGLHSVNITNVKINTREVVYKNRTKPGGSTVLTHSEFLRGRNTRKQPSRNTSVSLSISIGSPRLKPIRETRMPVSKPIAPRITPPAVQRYDNRELRNRFPRVNPVSAPEQRRPQSAPVVTHPAVPTSRPPQNLNKPTTNPVIIPAERKPPIERPQQQTTSDRRDESHQPSAPAPAVSQPSQQPATPTPGIRFPAPASRPQQPVRQQREEQLHTDRPQAIPVQPAQPAQPAQQTQLTRPVRPLQVAPPTHQVQTPTAIPAAQRPESRRRPVVTQNRPAATPPREEVRQNPSPGLIPSKPAPVQQAEQPRNNTTTKEVQRKKVWRITTQDAVTEKDSKGKERK